jgi:hypothetical protein
MTSTEVPMTGANLKVTLGSMGLPPSWFAARMNVTMRTVVRWFDGSTVAPEVTAELEKLSEATVAEMQKMVAEVDPDAEMVTLHTYRTDEEYDSVWPASWHRALVFRVTEHLKAQGHIVNIEYK